MKDFRMQLLHSAVIIPDHPKWGSQVLGVGSVVQRASQHPSPLTGSAGDWKGAEVYVEWADLAGRVTFGWLAGTTEWKRTTLPVQRKPFHTRDALSAWDHLRAKIYGLEREVVKRKQQPSVITWMEQYVSEQYRAELLSVVRQFGGRAGKTDTLVELTSRALSLILNRRYTMKKLPATDAATATDTPSTATATKKSSKKKGKPTTQKGKNAAAVLASAKKAAAAKKEAAPTRGVAADPLAYRKQVGEEALLALKAAKVTDGVREAKLLAGGKKINNTSITTLIEACNAGKRAMRAAGRDKVDNQLSRVLRKILRRVRKA